MAYGGGIFLPSEQAYKDPNRFRDVLEAEGNKQAKYLADMDQFFAQLEEMTRQFDVTAEFKERVFEEEMAFKTEELAQDAEESALDRALSRWTVGEQVGVQREGIRSQADYRSGMLEIQREQLGAGISESERKTSLEEEKFGLEESKTSFAMDIYGAREARTQETHDTAKGLVTGDRGTTEYGGYFEPDSGVYDPYGDKGFSDWLDRQ